jgi:hypothetical protein
MSVIRSRVSGAELRALFEPHTAETLYAYAAFVGESVTYVLTQLVDTVLANDQEFVAWRTTHPGTFVPPSTGRAQTRSTRRRRRPRHQPPAETGTPTNI